MSGPSLSVADGRGIPNSYQTGLLAETVLTSWVSVVMRLSVAILSAGVNDVLTLGTRTLREQLDIGIMQGLKAKLVGRASLEAPVTGWAAQEERE